MGPHQQCGICIESVSKYKCPVCWMAYCSLLCYKVHKQNPCAKTEAPSSDDGELSSALSQPTRDFEEEDESGWRLQRAQLENACASKEVKELLRNSELQKLIRKIDSSTDAEKDLDKMVESSPDFKEFTEKLLAIIHLDEI